MPYQGQSSKDSWRALKSLYHGQVGRCLWSGAAVIENVFLFAKPHIYCMFSRVKPQQEKSLLEQIIPFLGVSIATQLCGWVIPYFPVLRACTQTLMNAVNILFTGWLKTVRTPYRGKVEPVELFFWAWLPWLIGMSHLLMKVNSAN